MPCPWPAEPFCPNGLRPAAFALQPHAAITGLKGCGGCHKIGILDQSTVSGARYGMACNSCHSRHKFSKAEARRPQSCNPCHQGAGYIQWEAWSHSKHGVIYSIEGDTGRAPTCQTCHMQGGDHNVITGWGELAVLPGNQDPEWAQYREAIFKYLQAMDPQGNPTPGMEGILSLKMLRGSLEEWSVQREKMTNTCTQCHSRSYAVKHLNNTDQLIKNPLPYHKVRSGNLAILWASRNPNRYVRASTISV